MTWYLSYRIAFLLTFGLVMWLSIRYTDPLAEATEEGDGPTPPAARIPTARAA